VPLLVKLSMHLQLLEQPVEQTLCCLGAWVGCMGWVHGLIMGWTMSGAPVAVLASLASDAVDLAY
jgi:hypothetical protein